MLVPLSWLKDYVDIDCTPQELEKKLFSCGFEVEELIELGKEVSSVVVGLVEEGEPIPETHLHGGRGYRKPAPDLLRRGQRTGRRKISRGTGWRDRLRYR